jgi:hypothetical protein
MNTQILKRFGTERRRDLTLFYVGVACAVLGALVGLEVVVWAFQAIIRLLTHQI